MTYFKQESERLRYRKLTEKDIPCWVEFFVGNDRLHILGIDVQKTKETLAEEWIQAQLLRYEKQGLGHLAVELKANGEFIGMGGILPRELLVNKEFEIAYSLKPKYWGNGFATVIAQTMKDYGLKHIEANRFISIIAIENHASAHVARKNGMNVLISTEYLGMEVEVFGVNKVVLLSDTVFETLN